MKSPILLRFAVAVFSAILCLGCEGATGPVGPAGSNGSPGLSALETVSVDAFVSSNGQLTLRPQCPGSKKVISGGFSAGGDGSQFVTAYQSYPDAQVAWVIAVHNGYVGSLKVIAFAVCANTT